MDHATKNPKRITFFILILIAILFSNIPGFKQITGMNSDYYRYSNDSGTVTRHEILAQGRYLGEEFAYGFWKTKEFERAYPGSTDTVLCRNFAINPSKFWRWGEYVFN